MYRVLLSLTSRVVGLLGSAPPFGSAVLLGQAALLASAVVLGSAFLVGCTTDVVVDAGPEPPTGPLRELTLESEASLTLAFGEVADVRVRLTEGGAPVVSEPLLFAFAGNAQDASLDPEQTTDAEGRARTVLVAGSSAAVFRVRSSAERADPTFVNVSVGNEGFGAVEVTAGYDGERSDYERRVLNLYAGVPCDATELPRSPARTIILDDPADAGATFRTLAAGLSYTVVGHVEGPTGAGLATACVDAIEVTRDEVTAVTLDFADATLLPEGTYQTELVLDSMFFAPATTLGVDATSGLSSASAAGMYLDALGEELSDRGLTDARAALDAARAGGASSTVAMRLDDDLVGPSVAVATFFDGLLGRLERVRLGGPLELRVPDARVEAEWQARDLVVGPVPAPDTPDPLFLDPTSLDVEPMLEVGWDRSDALALQTLSVRLAVGELVTAAMTAAAIEAGPPGAALQTDAGCDVLGAWVAETPEIADACDVTCVEAACRRALAPVFEAAQEAIADGDLERDDLEVAGTLTLYDDDADLEVDRFEGVVTGTWSGASVVPGDEVSGTLAGTRPSVME